MAGSPSSQNENDKKDPSGGDRNTQFLHLLNRSERRLAAFVLSLVPNWADADEIVQQTRIRLWQQFDAYRPEEDFGAWACTIARFEVLTYRKRVGREKARFSEPYAAALAAHMETVGDVGERQAALADCLEKLSDKSREVIRQYYADEADVAQLAARHNRTPSAVYKSLAASRVFLHDCIEQTLAESGGDDV